MRIIPVNMTGFATQFTFYWCFFHDIHFSHNASNVSLIFL